MTNLLSQLEEKALSEAKTAYAKLTTEARAAFHAVVKSELGFASAHPLILAGIAATAGVLLGLWL